MRAGIDWIWIIIFVVIALSQGWKKVSEQMGGGDDQPVPPQPVPQRPPRPRTAAPAPLRKQPQVWRVGDSELREYVEHVRQVPPPPPIPQATPVQSAPPPPPLDPEKPVSSPPAVVSQRQPSRASMWGAALRDKDNLRNVILSAEIIGPPKSLS